MYEVSRFPVLTTVERNAGTFPTGFVILNSTINSMQKYNGVTWDDLGPSGSGANTALSNLTATNVNETLNMAAGKTVHLPFNTALLGRNSTDTADLDLVKSTGSETLVVGNSAKGFVQIAPNGTVLGSENSQGELDFNYLSGELFGDFTNTIPMNLNFWDGGQNFRAGLRAPTILAADYDLTLPPDDGLLNQVMTSDGSGILSFTSKGDLTNHEHIVSQQATAPTNTTEPDAGTGASSSVDTPSTDVAGHITLTTGTGANAGLQMTVVFDVPYAVAPIVMLTPSNTNAAVANNNIYVTASTTEFDINAVAALTDATAYGWNYHVIEAKN